MWVRVCTLAPELGGSPTTRVCGTADNSAWLDDTIKPLVIKSYGRASDRHAKKRYRSLVVNTIRYVRLYLFELI